MSDTKSRTDREQLQRPAPGRGARSRGIMLGMGLAAIASLATGFTAVAQEEIGRNKSAGLAATPPMPPMRPATLSVPPPAPVASAPPAPVVPPGMDPMVADFAPDMPQDLPPASRAQMHKCGSEWQKMKELGAATDKTWLAFASVCLVR